MTKNIASEHDLWLGLGIKRQRTGRTKILALTHLSRLIDFWVLLSTRQCVGRKKYGGDENFSQYNYTSIEMAIKSDVTNRNLQLRPS
jgi:hypothetical protein